MDVKNEIEKSKLYYPDDDYNFLLWTLLPFDIHMQVRNSNAFDINYEVVPIRKDGGRYIAFAFVKKQSQSDLNYNEKFYRICGYMIRTTEESDLYLWQLNTCWSDRNDWRDLKFRDVKICDKFLNDLAEDINEEEFAFLLKKGYIKKSEDSYKLNVVWVDKPDIMEKIEDILPDLTDKYEPIVSRLYEKRLEIEMRNQPDHIKPKIDFMTKTDGGKFTPYILKYLLDIGKLKEPKQEQKKTVTTLMGYFK